jgi:hypothetical protein
LADQDQGAALGDGAVDEAGDFLAGGAAEAAQDKAGRSLRS